MNAAAARLLRLLVIDAARLAPEPPALIFSDSTTERPQIGAFVVVTIRDGESRMAGLNLSQESASLELAIYAERGGDAVLRGLADHFAAALAAADLGSEGVHLLPPSRTMGIGDTASHLVCTLSSTVTTFTRN